MNRVFMSIALVSGLAAWGLMAMIVIAIFSSVEFSARICQSGCTTMYYYASLVVASLGMVMSFLALRSSFNIVNILITLLNLSVFIIVAFLFIAGNFF